VDLARQLGVARGLGVGLVVAAGRGDPEPGDAAAVHFGHRDPVAVHLDRLPDSGDLAQAGQDEAGRGLIRPLRQVDPRLLGELVQVEQAVHLDLAAAQPPRLPVLDVVLVADVADELLDQVLQRDDAGRAAVLVDHDGQVGLLPAHLGQGRQDGLAHGQELDVPGYLSDRERSVGPGRVEQVTDVHETDHIVV
jgi:hypothetical protein